MDLHFFLNTVDGDAALRFWAENSFLCSDRLILQAVLKQTEQKHIAFSSTTVKYKYVLLKSNAVLLV